MPVSSIAIKDYGNVSRSVAARFVLGAFYPMDEPEVQVVRIVAADAAGDATEIEPNPCVLRAMRLFNGGDVACHAKAHDVAGVPVVGVAPVAYSVSAQAGTNNPDPRVSAGGMAFATGLSVSLVTGIADDDDTGVEAGKAILEVEYHLA